MEKAIRASTDKIEADSQNATARLDAVTGHIEGVSRWFFPWMALLFLVLGFGLGTGSPTKHDRGSCNSAFAESAKDGQETVPLQGISA
jgi:hypothetical protein